MNDLLRKLKNPKYKLSLSLLTSIVLFMQCYLLLHKIEHHEHHPNTYSHHEEHDTHEIVQDCQLCLGAQQINQTIFATIHNLSLSLLIIFIIYLCQSTVLCSPAFGLPQTRAPPRF